MLTSILLRQGIRSDSLWTHSFLIKEPFRRIPFALDTYAFMRSQYWPREKLKKLGIERFAEIVKHASTIPFWKERFSKAGIDPNNFTESDITCIPILTKQDFQKRQVEEYTDPKLLLKSKKYSTSGSTGRPFSFYHDEAFEVRASAVAERMFRIPDDNKKRFPLVLMRGLPYGFNPPNYQYFFLKGYTAVQERLGELQKLLAQFPKGVILHGIGSSLLELARVCKERGVSLPLHYIISSGEALLDSHRKEIETTLHAKVHAANGMMEVRWLGFECGHRRVHIAEDSTYFEITDEHGAPLPAGMEGRIVITNFDARVMPFIRYNTGDIGVISEESCLCGRTLRTLVLQGRKIQLLDVGDGRTVSLINLVFPFGMYEGAVRQFQIVRTGECAFTMRIVPGPSFDEKMDGVFYEQFKSRIHPDVQIAWEMVSTLPEGPNGKAVYFIDEFERASNM